MNKNLLKHSSSLLLFLITSACLKCSTKDSILKRNVVWFGTSKTSYFLGRSPANQSDVSRTIYNGNLGYFLGYDYYYPISKAIVVSTGCNYSTTKFRMEYSEFATPNISKGSVKQLFRVDRLSIPISLNYKTSISNTSYFLLGIGFESFFTTIFKKNGTHKIRIYDENGQLDKSSNVQVQVKNEGLSWFRTVNFSGKLFLNSRSKNRLYLGVNYYLMSNYFPMEIKTNMFIGQKNFSATNNPNFEGVRFSAGYTW